MRRIVLLRREGKTFEQIKRFENVSFHVIQKVLKNEEEIMKNWRGTKPKTD